MKYIIRENAPENSIFETYFDDDGLTEKGGDYCYNLFIVCSEGWGRLSGFNLDEYKNIRSTADNLLDGFVDVEDGLIDYDGKRYTYKGVMTDCGIQYNSTDCHRLKEWAKNADTNNTDDIAAFLSILTKKKWDTVSVYGYNQGDYCEVVYCTEYYSNPRQYGEIWLGCGKEFEVITLDEDENETEVCGGYIIADCEVRNDEDYKRLVCEWACIPPKETKLEMIENCYTCVKYTYKAV